MFAHLYFITKKKLSTKRECVHKILATWWISNCLWRQLTFPVLWTDTTQRQLRLDHCDWLSRNLLSSPLFICKINDYNSYIWYKVYCDWHSRNLLGSPLFICNAGNSLFSLPKCKVVFVRWYLTCKVVPYRNY